MSEISKTVDSVFKELSVCCAVLIGVIYALLLWLTVPSKSSTFVVDVSIAMIVPLIAYSLLLNRRSFTEGRGKKGIISLIAWGNVTVSFLFDSILLGTMLLTVVHVDYLVICGIIMSLVTVFGFFFVPYEKAVTETTNYSINMSKNQESYIKRWKWRSRSFACFFIVGVCIAGIIVLLPFALFPAI